MAPTLEDVAARGFLPEIETLHLDRDYDYPSTPRVCAGFGITDARITARRQTALPTRVDATTSSCPWDCGG